MNRLYFTFIFLFFVVGHMLGQYYTISGYITIDKSGETLISAAVFDKNAGKGTISNSYGFYSLTLPGGEVELNYSYVGLSSAQRSFMLTGDTVINIKLSENTNLNEVTVVGNRKGLGVKGTQMSAINIPVTQIKKIPSLLGETDVIKALQLLPGVKAGNEGSAGMFVRGGGPDENLLILDGVPVYNVNHLFGFFSVFNTDAIKDVTLYKGSFPARFGGRLSSVVDISMNDGNDKEIHGNVTVGLISSKLNLEGPIVKEKTTFNFSARRTYADILTLPFMSKYGSSFNGGAGGTKLGYYFYDLNGKISHKISDKDRLYLSAYMGNDVIYADMQEFEYKNIGYTETGRLKMDWDWGNLITALRWNHVVSNKLFMNTTASLTRYRFDMIKGTVVTTVNETPPSTVVDKRNAGFKSLINDYALKIDFDWSPTPNHTVKFGVNYINHTFSPGVSILKQQISDASIKQNTDTTYGDAKIYAQEMSAYFEDNFSISPVLELNLGLHYSTFLVQNHFYNLWPQPRLGLRVLLNDNLSVKAGFASMSQYVHLLSNSNISLPTDLWVPVTKRIPPMQSSQYSAGVFYNFRNLLDFSVEAYYKSMDNLIEYKDGASFFGSTTGWEDKVSIGKGWAYGIELLVQKSVGNTTGWLGYTWSRTERLFDRPGQRINNGVAFPAKYDRPHSISIVGMHKFSEKIDIAATWVYSSGQRGTLALHYYDGTEIPQHTDYETNVFELPYISSRNNYKLPATHRLDVGINFHKKKKHGVRTWNVSLYNAYNHMNPFLVTITEKNIGHNGWYALSKKELTQVSLFPIIPSVSYSYKF